MKDVFDKLAGYLCIMPLKTRKEYRNAMREALKKPVFVPSVQNCQLRSQQQPHGTVGSSTELVIRTWPPALLVLVRVYTDSLGAGRAGPGGVGGTTSGVVAPGVEHAGDRVRLPGP